MIAKLAAVMGVVSHVPKRGYNDFHRYQYVMEADLVATIRPLLAAAGIMIIPSVIRESFEPGVSETRRGEKMNITRLLVQYTITDGKSEISMSIPGHGMDSGDKGVYKALTGSVKYALMKLFEVDTGDDPESDSSVDRAVSVSITPSSDGAERGGHSTKATRYQLQRIVATVREKNIDAEDFLKIMTEVVGLDPTEVPEDPGDSKNYISNFLRDLAEEDAGILVSALDKWGSNEIGYS